MTTKFNICFALFVLTLASGLVSAQSADLIASDFDESGRVDFADFLAFAENFGRSTGQEGFDSKFDLDGSNSVDFGDFLVFAANFGKLTSGETETFLYIADFISGRVEVVDISTNLVIPSRAFSVTFPRGLAFGPETGLVFVASRDTLFAYTNSGQRSYFIELTPVEDAFSGGLSGPGGFKVIVNGSETRAFVSEDAGLIEVFDLVNRVSLGQIPVGTSPTGLALSADESELYVGRRAESVGVVDLASQTLIDSIQTGTLTNGRIATSPSRSRIYVVAAKPDADHASGSAIQLLSLDPTSRSLVDSIQISRPGDLGTQPVDISVSSDGESVYLSVNRTDPGPSTDLTTLVQVGTLITVNVGAFTITSEISALQVIAGFGISPDGTTGYVSGVQDLTDFALRVYIVDLAQGEFLSPLALELDSGAEFLFTSAKAAIRSAMTFIELSFFGN
jgi:DNA-binding beta-propeller fold protein YncE